MMSGDDSSSVNPDTFDQHYRLALFQRGLQQSDPLAQCALEQSLRNTVLSWMRLHPKRDEACHLEDEATYVIHTFEHFWRTMAHHSQSEFSTFDVVLLYLRLSLNSVLMDAVRIHLRPIEASHSRPGAPSASALAACNNANKTWEHIRTLLADGHEERLAYLLFHCGLKPGEIVCSCPQEFSDVREISHLRHKIIERVLRDQVNAP